MQRNKILSRSFRPNGMREMGLCGSTSVLEQSFTVRSVRGSAIQRSKPTSFRCKPKMKTRMGRVVPAVFHDYICAFWALCLGWRGKRGTGRTVYTGERALRNQRMWCSSRAWHAGRTCVPAGNRSAVTHRRRKKDSTRPARTFIRPSEARKKRSTNSESPKESGPDMQSWQLQFHVVCTSP